MYIFDYNHILMDKYYRKEIDGLRSIAVLGVLIYHIEFFLNDQKIFSGGFFGVDIFFVISGYLISKLIINELSIENKFNFRKFYFRRAKRILPALYLMIFVSFIFGWFYLTPKSFLEYSNSITSSVFFFSNYFFFFQGLEYNSESSFLKPLLHTWSLSVEEQFYIFFPFILVLVFKYQKKNLGIFLVSSFLLFLIFSDWSSRRYVSFSFYSIHTRFWELLIGVILAYYEIKFGRKVKSNFLNSSLVFLGIILILFSVFSFNDQIAHPSIYTLLPVIGVSLIIWFSHKEYLTIKVLSSKLFVSVGLISYSLYLWHYPVFAFSRTTDIISGEIINKIFVAFTIIFLSIFTYIFVEKPARNKSNKFIKIFKFIFISYFILILSFVIKDFILNDKKLIEYNVLKNDKKNWFKCTNVKNDDYCKFGNYEKQVYLIGDSHTIPLGSDLGKKLNQINYSLVLLYEEAMMYKSDKNKIYKSDKRFKYLKNIKDSIFIFGGYYQRLNEKHLNSLFEIYEKDFQIFRKNNNKIIFINPVPEISMKFNLIKYKLNENYEIAEDKDKILKRLKLSNSLINNLKNINIIFTQNIFCDDNLCYALKKQKQILKSDFDHPSLLGSKLINNLIIKKIKDIE